MKKGNFVQKTKIDFTLFLLCFGYLIDFYDLTVMGVSYNELLREQFNITSTILIQQTYLLICNFQTVGIFAGALVFGILGDKIGRVKTISFSILFYSIVTILSAYTTSLNAFIVLRFLAYLGLSCEFATSSTLILERYSPKSANMGNYLLYCFGIFGGIIATSVGFFSWRAMFIFGGIAGIFLCLMRSRMKESFLYNRISKQNNNKLGHWQEIFNGKEKILQMLKLFALNVPFYVLVSLMFIIPNFMSLNMDASQAVKIVLMGFFTGNICSCLIGIALSKWLTSYKTVMFFSFLIFVVTLTIFPWVSAAHLFLYSIFLGLVGGAYPVAWMQMVGKSYPTSVRSTASNFLFALGRGSGIIFNILVASWISNPTTFHIYASIAVVLVFIVSMAALYFTQERFNAELSSV